jgi:hypothetical protein
MGVNRAYSRSADNYIIYNETKKGKGYCFEPCPVAEGSSGHAGRDTVAEASKKPFNVSAASLRGINCAGAGRHGFGVRNSYVAAGYYSDRFFS